MFTCGKKVHTCVLFVCTIITETHYIPALPYNYTCMHRACVCVPVIVKQIRTYSYVVHASLEA